MTTKPQSELKNSGMGKWRKVGLATSTVVALGATGSLFVFGFSWMLLFLAMGGISVSLGSSLFHYIGSGAYLESNPTSQKRRLQSQLNSLKFKVDDEFHTHCEFVIEQLNQRKKFGEQFQKVLLRNFSETEMTYQRYWSLWLEVSDALEKEGERIAESIEASIILKEKKDVLIEKINTSRNQIEELLGRSSKLYLSFQENQKEENREALFEQLEELSKRTNKYLNL